MMQWALAASAMMLLFHARMRIPASFASMHPRSMGRQVKPMRCGDVCFDTHQRRALRVALMERQPGTGIPQ